MTTPVVFIIFKRPDTTLRVFEEIRRARPTKLLIIADGPRADHPEEKDKCAAARAIVENIDWDCEVLRNYSDTNMGCRRRVSSGLDWAFDMVEEAIILEDDCLPHPAFFQFCDELLEKYRHDERVAMIRGDNWPETRQRDYSYYFSVYPSVWGWASWRRVWKNYDVTMKRWPDVKKEPWFGDWLGTGATTRLWTNIFDGAYTGKIETWAYPFIFTAWCGSQLSISPCVNLVSNIGDGADSTHDMGENNPRLNRPLMEMPFPLKHPEYIVRCRELDAVGEVTGAKIELKVAAKVASFVRLMEAVCRRANFGYLRGLPARVYSRMFSTRKR